MKKISQIDTRMGEGVRELEIYTIIRYFIRKMRVKNIQ